MKTKVSVTSDYPCQIPVIGQFEAGETKVLSDDTQYLFREVYGYKATAGLYPRGVVCTVELLEDEEA